MSNEVPVHYPSGNSLYFIERNDAGQVWYPTGEAYITWGDAGTDMDDYDLALVDKSGSLYVGSIDPNTPAGRPIIQAFLKAGANPADSDMCIGRGRLKWNGSSELTADKVLANKAVQNKSTGAVTYYDDDGVTPILVHTPTDGESTITRTPS